MTARPTTPRGLTAARACRRALGGVLLLACAACTSLDRASAPDRAGDMPAAERGAEGAAADEVAAAVMNRLGGSAAWQRTRFIGWTFFGARTHVWDRHTGRVRIESRRREDDARIVTLMDLDDGAGEVWIDGTALAPGAERDEALEAGRRAWINDSYWLVMPYKLRDPGVTLRSLGEQAMIDGRVADALEVTFDAVGVTPENKYHVYVARDTGLVEQWDFFRTTSDVEPAFQIPWRDWRRYGVILLSGDRGERQLTGIAVYRDLPDSVFNDPAPVDWADLPALPVSDI